MPEAFWRLTFREFQLRYAGFIREQNRQMGLVVKLAALTANYSKKHDRQTVDRQANALRQYPVKKWLS